MKQEEITKIVDITYPLISEDYSDCSPEVELHKNIYERLSGEKGMTGEACAHAEYDWGRIVIYLYTSRMFSEEDIIRSLIHECVHATQSYELYEAYYKCKLDYETHPYEIEAEHEEEKWINYKIKK